MNTLRSATPPALTLQSKNYPDRFEGRVPKQIKMVMTVHPDPVCIIGDRSLIGLELRCGGVYQAWTSSTGAVAGISPDGRHLGVKPDVFEVVEWY